MQGEDYHTHQGKLEVFDENSNKLKAGLPIWVLEFPHIPPDKDRNLVVGRDC